MRTWAHSPGLDLLQWKRIFGLHAHADWHWSDKARKPPTELVRWLAQNDDPYFADVLGFLVPWALRKFVAFLRGKSRREQEEDRKAREKDSEEMDSAAGSECASDERRSEDLWAARLRQLRAGGGLLSIYVSWALFAYFSCA